MCIHQEGVRAARQNLPLFYVPWIERIGLPYEEYILWYSLHPDHLIAAKSIFESLTTYPDTPDWMKESVSSNWANLFCPDC